jgi:hypothetical protein
MTPQREKKTPPPAIPYSTGKKIMHKVLLVSMLLTVSTQAVAQGGGTPEERAACSRDVHRFCRPAISQGDMGVLACLQQNRTRISKACDQVLRNHGQ